MIAIVYRLNISRSIYTYTYTYIFYSSIVNHRTMSESRENVHNFAAGPSPLPTPVLQKAAEGLLNYNGTGMGVCELSHRGKDFKAIIEGAEGKLKPHAVSKLTTSQHSEIISYP